MSTPLILTRATLAQMDESRLRKEVLEPLFRAMGFKGVRETHGSTERGKDFILWDQDKFGEREYYGVVVLATVISGRAEGTGSTAAKVAHQVRQSLGSSFSNDLQMRVERINKCYVITSKEVKAPARQSLQDVLSDVWRNVILVDGNNLWRLVEEHLKPTIFPGKLLELHEVLNSLTPNYDLIAEVGGSNPTIRIGEKQESGAPPLVMVPSFHFPETKEGSRSKAALRRHIRTGKAVTIPREFISSFEVSEELVPLLEAFPPSVIIFDSAEPKPLIPVTMTVSTADGVSVELAPIDFRIERRGTHEATLSNSAQEIPWKVRVTFRAPSRRVALSITFGMTGANVRQQLEMVRFQQALANGGVLQITRVDDGCDLARGIVQPGTYPAPADEVIVGLEQLCEIQRKTGIRFTIPREVQLSQLIEVKELATIVTRGEIRHAGGSITIPLKRKSAERLLQQLRLKKHLFFAEMHEIAVQVFGVPIPLGRKVMRVDGKSIAEAEITRIEKEIRQSDQEMIDVTLDLESEITIYFPLFQSEHKRRRFETLYASRSARDE